MNYADVDWSQYDKIVVTGPQRSGTRVCARMIADDTGHKYIDETAIGFYGLSRACKLLKKHEQCVLQCPALCRYAHKFDGEKVAIVLMRRDLADIKASEERIGWERHATELARYELEEGEPAAVKYAFWEERQRDRITNPIEIEYESLAVHPLWVPKEKRARFAPHQTRPRTKKK